MSEKRLQRFTVEVVSHRMVTPSEVGTWLVKELKPSKGERVTVHKVGKDRRMDDVNGAEVTGGPL
jgi:hypothetical protein